MPRMYVLNSWVGAAEYDEGDTYNGNQVGNRAQRSVEIRMSRDGDGYKTNSKAPKKPKKEVSLRDSILIANRHLDRLEKLSERLESEYLDGDVSHADYILMRKNLDKRLERAWKRVEKENFYEDEEDSLTASQEQAINIKRNTDSLGIFESLSPDNSFRRAYILLKNFRVKLSKILLILSEDSRGEEK